MNTYKICVSLLYPIIYLYLKKRMLKGKEDKLRFNERLGKTKINRPNGFLIWLHGASIGEITALQSVIDTLSTQYPNVTLLLTSGTTTSANIASKRYPNIIHQYVPIDVPFAVNRFIKHWHPNLAIRIESDLWPLQLQALKENNIPNILLNGAVTEKAFQKYIKYPKFVKNMMSSFNVIFAKSENDSKRLTLMGAKNVIICDNIKFTNPAPIANTNELNKLKSIFENKTIWHSAVIGEGEEEIILNAHKEIMKFFPKSILIITPRHPKLGSNIETSAKKLGLNPIRRSINPIPDSTTNVYIADTLGEMGLFYRLTNITFMGRSLLNDCRGSNPLEAAKLNSVVMVGPYTSTFDELYDEMKKSNIIDIAKDSTEIANKTISYLQDSSALNNRIENIKKFLDTKNKTLDTIMEQIKKYLPHK